MSKRSDGEWDFLYILLLPFSVTGLILLAIYEIITGIFDSPLKREKRAQELNQNLYEQAVINYSRDKHSFVLDMRAKIDSLDHDKLMLCDSIAIAVWDFENFDIPKPPPVANSIEGARYRDELSTLKDIKEPLAEIVRLLFAYIASIPPPREGLSFPMRLGDSITAAHVETLIYPFLRNKNTFLNMASVLEVNINKMADSVSGRKDGAITPANYTGKLPLSKYVEHTPLEELMQTPVPLTIPTDNLFEHVHVLGSTGSGKTQLLQTLIIEILTRVPDCSLVVIDSQGEMLKKIMYAKELVDGDRLVWIDPSDVEYPLALNIFDVGVKKTHTNQAELERHINGIVDLVTYVLSSILDSATTDKQGGLLTYVIRLLAHIPDANLSTLRAMLKPGGLKPEYQPYIAQLSASAQAFFATEFNDKQYDNTKKEIGWRIDSMTVTTPTIERIFGSTETLFNMSEAMDDGKVVLINTAKDFLLKEASAFFGRFFVSLIARATQQRATQKHRRPTFVIIDEAQDILDKNIATMLEQARKYNVSLIIANHNVTQIPADIRDALLTNTHTKFVGGVNHNDARLMAAEMRSNTEFLAHQDKFHFALYSKGVTAAAVGISVEPGRLENLEQRSEEEVEELIEDNRDRYAAFPDEDDDEGLDEGDEVEIDEIEDELEDFKPAPEDPIPPQ